MGRIDNLTGGGELKSLMDRHKRLERAAPAGFTTVSRGAFTISSDEGLIVNGSELVNGTLHIVGVLEADGTVTLTGTMTNTGTTNLNGPVHVTGATELSGTLTVDSGGKITVAGSVPMTVGLTGAGVPGVAFSSGGTLYGLSGGIAIASGSRFFGIDATSHFMTGAAATTVAANVYVDSTTGRIFRTSSARRFKIGPKLMKLAPALLDVRMKDWIDKGARKRGEPDVRVPGVIAEEVAAAGGEQFVTRDAEGQIEGVAYDRLALARTQILAAENDALRREVEEQRRDIEELRQQMAEFARLFTVRPVTDGPQGSEAEFEFWNPSD